MSRHSPYLEPFSGRDPDPATVKECLARILGTRVFQRADQISRLLKFVVEKSLSGEHGELKELCIATAFFGKAPDYDTKIQSTVRSAANRLRKALADYYCCEGLHDEVVISLPTGHYIARFERRSSAVASFISLAARTSALVDATNPVIVGQSFELEFLRNRAARSFLRTGTLTVLSGGAGMGKSTLMRRFMGEMRSRQCLAAFGKCYQEFTAGSPYLPWLEVLTDLARQNEDALRQISATATVWNTLMDGPASPSKSISASSLKRELVSLFSSISGAQLLLICIDDLHWADLSSLDLLNHVSRNLGSLPIMLIVGCRRSDLLKCDSPFVNIESELQISGFAEELSMLPLGYADVQEYLKIRLGSTAISDDVVSWIGERSEGNALFLTALTEQAIAKGWIYSDVTGWELSESRDEWQRDLPTSLIGVLASKLQALSADELLLLEAATIQGNEFCSDLLAATIGYPESLIEDRLQYLKTHHGMIRVSADPGRLPSGRPIRVYAFAHALYWEAVSQGIAPARRVELTRTLAQCLLSQEESRTGALSAHMALLLRDLGYSEDAMTFYLIAARNALNSSAYRQAWNLASAGVELAARQGSRDVATELALLTVKAITVSSLEGFGAREIESIHTRAQHLSCATNSQASGLAIDLMYWGYVSNFDYNKAKIIAESLVSTAESSATELDRAMAHMALGVSLLHLGNIRAALPELKRAHYLTADLSLDTQHLRFTFAPAIAADCMLARALWFSGDTSGASELAGSAVAKAQALGHDRTRAYAHALTADIWHLCGDFDVSISHAAAAIGIAEQHELAYEMRWAECFRTWALVQKGQSLSLFRRAIGDYDGPICTKLLGEHAGLALRAGDIAEASCSLNAAIGLSERHAEKYYLSELLSIRAELALAIEKSKCSIERAELDLIHAIETARLGGNTAYELRAAVRLAEFSVEYDRKDKELRLISLWHLVQCLRNNDSRDLMRAKRLLSDCRLDL